MRAERAVLGARVQGPAQLRAQRQAAGCRSLLSSGPTAAGSPERSAAISAVLSSGAPSPSLAAPRRAQPVAGGVDLGRGQAADGERQHPVVASRRASAGGQLLAPALADGGPAEQRERHVAAQPAPPTSRSSAGVEARPPELVAGDQGGGGVGAAAGQAGRDRDPLADLDLHRGPAPAAQPDRGQRAGRADREVGPPGRNARHVVPGHRHRWSGRPGRTVTSSYSDTAWNTVTRSW